MNKQEYLELCEEIRQHDWRYYIEANPLLTDEEYDKLYRKLLDIEQGHPEWIEEDSPSQRVGGEPTREFITVVHKRPMMSLGNTYSFSEVEDFVRRVKQGLENKAVEFVCEPKIDGIAISLHYQNGRFIQAVTRGNGVEGDDISNNIKTIKGFPLVVKQGAGVEQDFEVRGEVYMPIQNFQSLNQQRTEEGLQPFANPRNATAGSLKLLDPREVSKRRLRIWTYDLFTDETWSADTHSGRMTQLKEMYFPVVNPLEVVNSVEAIENYYSHIDKIRDSLPYEIDGVVIKLNSISDREVLGVTAKSPRWAVAYKFKARKAETFLISITPQVGRTGAITPVAELDPVFLGGSTIKRATLHNDEEIARLGLSEKMRVIIEKAGDVIPKVVRRADGVEAGNYVPPVNCPICNDPLTRTEGEVIQRCINLACPARLKGSLSHFASRSAMNIEGLGAQTVDLLIAQKMVEDPGDIYYLDFEKLESLPGFGELSVKKLSEGIEKSKEQTLDKLIFGLGIRLVGAGVARILAKHYMHLDQLINIASNPEEIEKIEEIGPKIAKSLSDYFSHSSNISVIEKLRGAGVNFGKIVQAESSSESYFNGKKGLNSGTVSGIKRDEMYEKLREKGARIVSSISSKTDFLIVGESPGSKLDKAEKLGLKIFHIKNAEEFHQLLSLQDENH